jgi:hypothetical protein
MSWKLNPFRRRARRRSVTIRAAWIAGICGVGAAIIGVVLAYELSSLSTPSSAPSAASVTAAAGPNLKVEDVEIALANSIDASVQAPGLGAPTRDKDTGSAIDITLRNNGNEPALIVNAVLSLMQATRLSCPNGAGAAISSAQYDVKVPAPESLSANLSVSANNPLILRRDMRFVVNASSVDRFRISVGPDKYSDVEWPWIYEFNLLLVEDNGKKLDLGPMTILGFSQSSATLKRFPWDPFQNLTKTEIATGGIGSCVAHDAAELSHAIADPGLHSPELQTMYREAKRLAANAPT